MQRLIISRFCSTHFAGLKNIIPYTEDFIIFRGSTVHFNLRKLLEGIAKKSHGMYPFKPPIPSQGMTADKWINN